MSSFYLDFPTGQRQQTDRLEVERLVSYSVQRIAGLEAELERVRNERNVYRSLAERRPWWQR